MTRDIFLAGLIGFLVAVLLLVVAQNLQEIRIPYLTATLLLFPLLSMLGMLTASFLGKRVPFLLQAAKFSLVGALNTFVDLGVLNFFIWLTAISSGLPYSLFKGISFAAAVLNSYVWNKHWTFSSQSKTPGKEFFQFLVVSTIGFTINVGLASFVVNVLGPQFGVSQKLWANIGAVSAVFLSLAWNFTGYKLIVFRK